MSSDTVVTRSVLPNGVRLVSRPMPEAKSATLAILVECGSRDDRPETAGTANLVPRLVHMGAGGRTALDIAREVEAIARRQGSQITPDHTLFRIETAPRDLPRAFALLSAVLRHPDLPASAVAAERQLVLGEIASQQRLPAHRARRLLRSMIWEDHALAHPISGSPETVRRIQRDDVATFMQQNYTADRIVIAAAGCLDHEALRQQAEAAFGSVRPGCVNRRELPRWRAGCGQKRGASDVSHFCFGFPVAGYRHQDAALFDLLCRTAGAALVRRLGDSCATGPVMRVRTEYMPYRDLGVFLVEGAARPATAAELRDCILSEWDTVMSRCWPADDAIRAAEAERLHLYAACDADPFSVARRAAIGESCGSTYTGSGVTPGELREFAAKQWEPCTSQASIACLGPAPEQPPTKVWVN